MVDLRDGLKSSFTVWKQGDLIPTEKAQARVQASESRSGSVAHVPDWIFWFGKAS